jgi:Ion channel
VRQLVLEFLYRFWIENEIWFSLVDPHAEPRPLTDEQRRYAEHYTRTSRPLRSRREGRAAGQYAFSSRVGSPTYRRAMPAARSGSWRTVARRDVIRVLDSYASLLVLLLANFFLLELVDDPRWGAIGSTILSAIALFVAISDPEAGTTINRRQALSIVAAVALVPIVLFVDSAELVGLAYLLPVALLVTATLPVTISRVLRHQRVTHETVFGALCAYVLIGLLFAFVYLALNEFREGPFFTQPGPHEQSEYLYFSFVALTTLGFGDLSPSVGLPQALTVSEALLGQVFLVTMVARLVTLWVRQGRESP